MTGRRIAVVGAYGNGKTTLTLALADALGLPRLHGGPMRDPVGGPPKPLDECTSPELVQLALRRFTERVDAEAAHRDGFVSDGSCLHEWAYLTVRLAVGRHPGPADVLPEHPADDYQQVCRQWGFVLAGHVRDAYDLVVHVPADVPLPPGETAINERFRALSDRVLLDVLDAADRPAVVVRGDLEERVRRVLSA